VNTRRRFRAGATAVAAIFVLAGCLDPVYEPGNVYDTRRILHEEPINRYENIELSLVEMPGGSSSRRIPLYHGSPDSLTYPVYKAPQGESFALELQGWKQPFGLCYSARFGEGGRVVERDSCEGPPRFWLDKDTLRLYVGGPSDRLTGQPLGKWTKDETYWSSPDGRIAILSNGELSPLETGQALLTPVGEGTVIVVAKVPGDLSDTAVINVVLDVPVIEAGAPDTTVTLGDSLVFLVNVTQEYGGVHLFAWDADGDGTFEDTLFDVESTQPIGTRSIREDSTGIFNMQFLVRDAEGNEATRTKRVRVVAPPGDTLPAD
jgi:hypothetical protein